MTPTNLARLAAWAGITPETHRAAFKSQVGGYPHKDACFRSLVWIFIGPDPTDPAADPQVVDDVWASRLMWTLATSHEWDTEGFDLYLTDTGDYGVVLSPRIYEADLKPANECAPSATLALLLAARAAGVPDVVECMGDEA